MGIDYSISFGYGFTVDETELPKPFNEMDSYEIADWLKEQGYTKIDCEWAGNMMSGPGLAFVYAKSTYIYEDLHNFDGAYDVGADPNPEEIKQLYRAAELLEYTGIIGPKVIGNVL